MNIKQYDIVKIQDINLDAYKMYLNKIVVVLSRIKNKDGNHLYCVILKENFDGVKSHHAWDNCCFQEYEYDKEGNCISYRENKYIILLHNTLMPVDKY